MAAPLYVLASELQTAIAREVPDFVLRDRQGHWFFRFLTALSPHAARMTTTVGATVYAPAEVLNSNNRLWRVLAHEWVHIHRAGRSAWSRLWWLLRYAFPQSLAALAVLAIPLGLLCGSWGLLPLVALVALAPLPAPWRAAEEIEAYAMGALCETWAVGDQQQQAVGVGLRQADIVADEAARALSSAAYWWASWSHEKTVSRIVARVRALALAQLLPTPFRQVRQLVRDALQR